MRHEPCLIVVFILKIKRSIRRGRERERGHGRVYANRARSTWGRRLVEISEEARALLSHWVQCTSNEVRLR